MIFFLILWALCSNTILCASLPQRSEGIGTGPISNSNSLSLTVPAPSSNNSSSSNALNIVCSARKYGKNLKVNSCRNVFDYLIKDETQHTFAERDSGIPFTVPLPWRTLSKDGLCFVQPVLTEGAVVGHASGTEVGQAAFTMLQVCVVERGTGGIASKIGGDNKIDVVIADYKPNVKCDPTSTPGPPWISSVSIFANMRASKQFRVFGKFGEPDVEEGLPLVLEAADSKSQLKIDIDGTQTVTSWYEIWEAVAAVAMMCARQKHKGGKAKGLGLDGTLHVELSAKQDETVGNASTVLGAGAGIALLQDFGAESSAAAGSLGFNQSSPFELLPAEVSQDDDSSVVTLPDDDDSEE